MAFRRLLLISIIIFLCQHTLNLFAQQPAVPKIEDKLTVAQKNEIWFSYVTKLYEQTSQKGIFANFPQIIIVARQGLQDLDQNDLVKKSAYHYYIGMSYKVQLQHDSALKYLKSSIENAAKSRNKIQELLAINEINNLYRFLGKSEATQPYANELIRLSKLTKSNREKDLIATGLSEYYLHNGDFNHSIALLLESLPRKLDLYNKNKNYDNKVNIGLAYGNLGSLYLQLGQNSNAIANFNQAKPYLTSYTGGMVRLCNNLVQAYLNIENLDSAKHYYQQVYRLHKDRTKFYEAAELSNANRFFANYYLSKKDYVQAERYAQLTNRLAVVSERPETILKAKHLLGLLSFYQQQYKKAIDYFKEALPTSNSFGKDFTNEILLKLAQSYESIGDFKQSLFYYKQNTALANQIFKDKNNEGILKVELKYKTQEKEIQINSLTAQKKIATQLLKKKDQYQIALITLVILLLFISFLIYINYRNKQKANQLLDYKNRELDALNVKLAQANHTKTKLFSIISHDLRSPVSQLFTFLKLQQTNPNVLSEENKQQHQQKLIQSSKQLLATMEDLLIWSKSQMEYFELDVTNVNIPGLFADAITLMQNQVDAKNVEIKIGELTLANLESDENLLTIVLRNLLQNAINNAFPHTAVVLSTGFNAQGKPLIAVSNKGDMIPPEKIAELLANNQIGSKSSGYGLLIVKELLQKINAKLQIVSNEQGTTMTVVFTP